MIRKIYSIFLVLTILIYLSVFLSPSTFALFGFAAMLIPVLVVLHVILPFFFLLTNRKMLWYSLFGLLISIPYLNMSFKFNELTNEPEDLSVLSYNVRVFNVYKHLNTNFTSSKAMIKWINEDNSSIKCFQEFYHDDASDIFDTGGKFLSGGKYESFISPFTQNKKGNIFGLAIFSKFPMIKKGKVLFEDSHQNWHAIYADLQLPEDTIRVYNIHLESMSIAENELFNSDSSWFDKVKGELYLRLKGGMKIRAGQVDIITKHIHESPYPVIVCGDFNELPYSYVYQRFKSVLHNSFERKGNGFGFSYNGKIPFLRIDNQFFDQRFKILQYHNLKDKKYSDHYPIKCLYKIID